MIDVTIEHSCGDILWEGELKYLPRVGDGFILIEDQMTEEYRENFDEDTIFTVTEITWILNDDYNVIITLEERE